MPGDRHPYARRRAVLSTLHGKAGLIAPPLVRLVGLQVDVCEVNTDRLGTFSGDVPRIYPPLETAIHKARLGMAASGCELGLASEGSIGPDPAVPMLTADREIVVLVDDANDLVIFETHTGYDLVTATTTAHAVEDLGEFLARADFPRHRLIVHPNSGPILPIRKGIADVDVLERSVAEAARASSDGFARIETDLRAHMCPSRQRSIAKAAESLALRVSTCCPSCGAPGWGRVDVLRGLPCRDCGTPTDDVRSEVLGCVACNNLRERAIVAPDATAEPGHCRWCNP